MDKSATWMPGLDLLTEYELDLAWVILWKGGEDGVGEGEEHLCREL